MNKGDIMNLKEKIDKYLNEVRRNGDFKSTPEEMKKLIKDMSDKELMNINNSLLSGAKFLPWNDSQKKLIQKFIKDELEKRGTVKYPKKR
jgi:hypothetical protein